MTPANPPAEIIGQALSDLGHAEWHTESDPTWAMAVGAELETPDNFVTLYDTQGVSDGRLMAGETIVHPGIQIRIRAVGFAECWIKAQQIKLALDGVLNQSVVMSDVEEEEHDYIIRSVSTGPLLRVGPDHNQRSIVTLNITTTIQLDT